MKTDNKSIGMFENINTTSDMLLLEDRQNGVISMQKAK
jgi:hypothetical protein